MMFPASFAKYSTQQARYLSHIPAGLITIITRNKYMISWRTFNFSCKTKSNDNEICYEIHQRRDFTTNFCDARTRLYEQDTMIRNTSESNDLKRSSPEKAAEDPKSYQNQNQSMDIKVALQMADTQWQNQDFDAAMESYTNILEILLVDQNANHNHNYDNANKEILKERKRLMAESLTRLGMCHAALNDHHEAFLFYNKAIEALDELFPNEANEKRGIVFNAKAMSHGNLGEMNEAQNAFELALKELSLESSTGKRANIHENLGTLCAIKKESDTALEHFEKALSIRKNENLNETSNDIAGLLLNIGRMHQVMKNSDKAIGIYQESISMLDNDIHPVAAQAYANLALIYSNAKQLDNAFDAHQRALSLQHSLLGEENEIVAETYNHLGTILAAKSDRGEALKYFRKSLKIYRAIGTEQTHPDFINVKRNISMIEYSTMNMPFDQERN